MGEGMEKELPAGRKEPGIRSNSEALLRNIEGSGGIANEKAFRVPVDVKTGKGGKSARVFLPTNTALADQASDMINVTAGFLGKSRLPTKSLESRGLNGPAINVADGSSARLTHCFQPEIGAFGIRTKVETFVRPLSNGSSEEIHLLLGLPWSHTVCAKIGIGESIIQIVRNLALQVLDLSTY